MTILVSIIILLPLAAASKVPKDEYTIGWILALPIELASAQAMLDEQHDPPDFLITSPDDNAYIFGRIGNHNLIITCLPSGRYGTVSAASVANQMHSTFPAIQLGLMVGIGGGAPNEAHDIRLGDIVVSMPMGESSGVVQYDFGKTIPGGRFIWGMSLDGPPLVVLKVLTKLRALHPKIVGNRISTLIQEASIEDDRFVYPGYGEDRFFNARYHHPNGRELSKCEDVCKSSQLVAQPLRKHEFPYVHYGIIASGNQVMKDGVTRDKITKETGAVCFEMEAAGLVNHFRSLVVRGICDYADSHKNKEWQAYAAITAAAFTKQLLHTIDRTALLSEINYVQKQRQQNLFFTCSTP
ncbi:hypothetical protein TWF281_007388 [Arthrobotrys megalospora]